MFKYSLKVIIIYCYNCGIITFIFIKKIFLETSDDKKLKNLFLNDVSN